MKYFKIAALLGLLSLAAHAQPSAGKFVELEMIDLKCNKTEDTTGADEAYMNIFLPGGGLIKLPGSTVWNLNNGQSTGNLGKLPMELILNGKTVGWRFELWDEDTGGTFLHVDNNDRLGDVTINLDTNITDGHVEVLKFTEDGADYELHLRYAVKNATITVGP